MSSLSSEDDAPRLPELSHARFMSALARVIHFAAPSGAPRDLLRRIQQTLGLPPLVYLPEGTANGRGRVEAENPHLEQLWWWPQAQGQADMLPLLDALLARLAYAGQLEPGWQFHRIDQPAVLPLIHADVVTWAPSGRWVLVPDERLLPSARNTSLWPPKSDSAVERPHVAVFELRSSCLRPVSETLVLAEHVRRALLRLRAEAGHSPVLTGKYPDGIPLEGHPHAFFLPYDDDGDGLLDRVLLVTEAGFDDEDVAALERLERLTARGIEDQLVTLSELGLFETFQGHPLLGPSRIWRSITPFSLPYFATRGAGQKPRPRDLPEGQLKRVLAARGFPAPSRILPLEGRKTAGGEVIPWDDFEQARLKRSESGRHEQGKGLAAFELEFDGPLSGPLALGFGAHFGLGLFRAI